MEEPEHPSDRLVEQRMRNRAMEALELLSEGDSGVGVMGAGEYVEMFYDIIDDDSPWRWREWSVFTPAEVEALSAVHAVLNEACKDDHQLDDEPFIASGWPSRIQPVATEALATMMRRGRFSEEIEESEPLRS